MYAAHSVADSEAEGKYRVGYTRMEDFDLENIKMNTGVSLDNLKKGLAGLSDGSLVIGENRLEYAKNENNAPASGEGVVEGQAVAESPNGAQRGVSETTRHDIAKSNQRKILSSKSKRNHCK